MALGKLGLTFSLVKDSEYTPPAPETNNILTEAGDTLVTESGDNLVTE